METAVLRGIFILLLYLQNIHGQQGVNNNGKLNPGLGLSQQTGPAPCPMQNSGYQFNVPQQNNIQQTPSQSVQSFNIPTSAQIGNFQPQSNQDGQGKINQLSDIFSALHNIRLYQTSNSNPSIKSGCASKNTEQSPSFIINKPNVNQVTSQPDGTKSQPSFTFQFVPVSSQNGQKNSQYYLAPSQSQQTSQQGNYYNQPANVASPQTSPVQSSAVIPVSSSQVNPVQSQPIVFALQSPQYSDIPVLSSSTQTPIMFNTQSQPLGVPTNQPSSKLQTANVPMDGKSIMSMLMSQFQNPQSNSNQISSSMVPGYLNGKQEKPSGMKALLPLIFNMLNERRSCCNQCGCPCSSQGVQEPTINTGYSTQKDYSQNLIQNDENKSFDIKETNMVKSKPIKKTKEVSVSEEASEEYEDDDDEDEDEGNE